MIPTVTVTLAGQSYEIGPLPRKASKAWRDSLGKPITDLVGILSKADTLELNNVADLTKLILLAKEYLIDSPDLIFGALCGYSPAIAADRERIEEEAFDYEIMDALVEVLKLAYPFGRLVGMFRSGNG
jgi:hypothetical protein